MASYSGVQCRGDHVTDTDAAMLYAAQAYVFNAWTLTTIILLLLYVALPLTISIGVLLLPWHRALRRMYQGRAATHPYPFASLPST